VTADLIETVRSRGADLLPLGQCLRILHPERLDSATIVELRREKPAVLRALEVELAANIIVYERLLSECRQKRAGW
jgi:hypothetical protein